MALQVPVPVDKLPQAVGPDATPRVPQYCIVGGGSRATTQTELIITESDMGAEEG